MSAQSIKPQDASRGTYRSMMATMLVLSLPLFVINMGVLPGWGGDYALYLKQAKHLVEGIPQSELGYVFNEDMPGLSPSAYPPGWPLLMAPVYALFGMDIRAFHVLSTLLLLCLGLVTCRLFATVVPKGLAMAGALVVVYHPYSLELKSFLLSDIPFALGMLCILLLYMRRGVRTNPTIMVGILTLTILIRPIGIVLGPAIFLVELLNWINHPRQLRPRWSQAGWLRWAGISLAAATLSAVLMYGVLRIPAAGDYFEMIRLSDGHGYSMSMLMWFYLGEIQEFFQFRPMSDWTQPLRYTLTGALLLGLLWRARPGFPRVVIVFAVVYFLAVSSFPYSQGKRFFYVFLPLMYLAAARGLHILRAQQPWLNGLKWAVVAAALIICAIRNVQYNQQSQAGHVLGPHSDIALATWPEISKHTPEDAVIAFVSPRVLTLYTDRRSLHPGRVDPDRIEDNLQRLGSTYILHKTWEEHPFLDAYLGTYGDLYEIVWTNDYFALYHRKRAAH
ncbi:MAG: hypothetical protein R3301_04950 [Saprospiraceae bacterium]|nr:hypothetical protein [Saprospiraceae bacterium]